MTKNLNQSWNQASHQILQTTINSLNETTARERNRKLSEFSTEALTKELLSRQSCSLNHLTCTKTAEDWITKPQAPTCFNCQQDILSQRRNSHER